ncbi:MAG: 1-acyl-sn-glycerol-3-phosphate acyltransferase [Lachnospiraceae bacterium]|nr:1-acyl-sn-glycerol-3-phosphate acyltransferase [Lachnospiraceae bacterium]
MDFPLIIISVIAVLFTIWVLFWVVVLICAACVNPNIVYTKNNPFYRFILKTLNTIVMCSCNIKIKASGNDIIPSDGNFLIVSNHLSKFDPLVLMHVLRKRNISFVSKTSNLKIPIFGKIAIRNCFIPIDRANVGSSFQSLMDASEILQETNVSVGIYPEGTRNRTDALLLPFHDGIFKAAQKASVPVLVVTVHGTDKIHKNAPLKRSVVNVDFCGVITQEYVKSNSSHAIADTAREMMLESISKYN